EVETLGLMVEVQPQVYASSQAVERALDSLVHVNGGELAFIARKIWRELGASDAAAPLALEGLVLELIAGLVRQSSSDSSGSATRPPAWLRAVRERLHEQRVPLVSLQSLAADVGVHPATLTR